MGDGGGLNSGTIPTLLNTSSGSPLGPAVTGGGAPVMPLGQGSYRPLAAFQPPPQGPPDVNGTPSWSPFYQGPPAQSDLVGGGLPAVNGVNNGEGGDTGVMQGPPPVMPAPPPQATGLPNNLALFLQGMLRPQSVTQPSDLPSIPPRLVYPPGVEGMARRPQGPQSGPTGK